VRHRSPGTRAYREGIRESMLKYRGLAGVVICACVAACSKSGGAASQDPAPIPVVVAPVEQQCRWC
jgi:hypothetical protein